MTEILDFQGYRAIVYNAETRQMIAEAKVLKYEKQTRTVTLKRAAFTTVVPDHVILLLLGAEVPVEFQGTPQRYTTNADLVEIALYRGKTKEERISVRYPMDNEAVVDHFYISKKLFPTHRVLQVRMLNISAVGCLLRGETPFFNIGTIFQMQTDLFGKQARLNAMVVRVKPVDERYADYGCRFYFPEE